MATTKTNLNLRTGAGTQYSIVTTMQGGREVAIGPVDVGGTLWYPLTYEGKQGWASGNYLDLGTAGSTNPAYDDYVSDAMALAVRMLGLWYRWAGNFTQEPFSAKRGDCSGYVGFVSESLGYRPGDAPLYNYSADSMFDNFRTGVWKAQKIEPGQEKAMDIVFYGSSSTSAGHVVFAVGDGRVIGASGGFEATLTDADAQRVGAKVRYDDLHFHKNPLVGIYRPDYGAGR